MKTLYLLVAFLLSNTLLFGQDTLLIDNIKFLGHIEEINPDSVKVYYVDDDTLSSVDKNRIQKIIFKKGPTLSLTEANSFKKVSSIEDFDNVSITSFTNEIKELRKIGDISDKVIAATSLSKERNVKNKAYRRLKIQGAMMGANVVYLSHYARESKLVTGYSPIGGFSSTSSTAFILSGLAYSTIPLDHNKFKTLINNKSLFTTDTRYILWSRNKDIIKESYKRKFSIINIKNENGTTIIEAQLEGEKKYTSFQLASFDEEGFNIFYKSKSSAYNARLSFN